MTPTFRPIEEFDHIRDVWPRGDRPAAIREAARRFRRRFKEQGQVQAVATADVAAAPYEAKLALAGVVRPAIPYVYLINRMMVVQYEDFDGHARLLAWEPTALEGSREVPYYVDLARRHGKLMTRIAAPSYRTLDEVLDQFGLWPEQIDYVTHDHLHVQDVRCLMGGAGRPPTFPAARLICQQVELDTFDSVHPLQYAWYVPDGMDGVDRDKIDAIEGDVELGAGIALISTPGHTDGNQSLVLNTPDGVWVSSENGVAADSWQPELSRIPRIRRYARSYRREVVMNSNTLEDSLDQYDSMVKEKALADRNPRDERWLNVLPSAELARFKIHWPVVPTFFHGGLAFGRFHDGASANGGRPGVALVGRAR
jgi:hypothetical protein